jgi:hypothetical protein
MVIKVVNPNCYKYLGAVQRSLVRISAPNLGETSKQNIKVRAMYAKSEHIICADRPRSNKRSVT